MSVKMMHLVFERFPLPGNDMVLALALADHAHDDGTNIFPGNERLAEKTRMSERTVIRLLKKFIDIGWLIKVKNSNSGRGYANVFRISDDWIKGGELLLKGDNLSPFNEDEKGDKKDERVTPQVNKGDIAVSLQPSLTINTTIKSARESDSENNRPGMTAQGFLAIRLINLGVKTSSMHPTLNQWVQKEIPIEFIEQCVAIARQKKPHPETISMGYLEAVLQTQLAERERPRVDNGWKRTNDGWISKGKELGVTAKRGELMDDFKVRVTAALNGKGE